SKPTANDTAHSDVKATPSELHSAVPEVIDVDVDHDVNENNTAPAAEQDDEADLETLKKIWRSAVYTFFKLDAVAVQYHNRRLVRSRCNGGSVIKRHILTCTGWHSITLAFPLPRLQWNVYFRKAGTFYTSLETACLRHQPVHSSVSAHGSAVIC
ncbi:hypothetical protein BDR05DRAFT_905897, partial [Suillus weaverae]